MNLRKSIFKKFTFAATAALILLAGSTLSFGQSVLGINGGLEGSDVVVDNATLATAGAANTWQKATATQTISKESSVVRSGSSSLRILNTSTTGRRVYSPLFSTVPNGSRLVLQYYRRRPAGNGQENQHGIAFPAESLSGTYAAATAADTWEKVTYVPTSTTTAGNKWALILHRLITDSTLPEYIDDMAVYVGSAVDNTAPNSPTGATVSNPTGTSLDVSWTAASGGVDDGGYIVVRSTTDPTTVPNANGIYTSGNTIGTGTVVYSGTGTSFTDSGLSAGTQYFYRVYTFDKAFNYSGASTANGTTSAGAVPSFAIDDVTVTEGDTGTTNAVFTVIKTNPNGSTSTVDFSTANGTATFGVDYTTVSGTLSFADGETSKTITVPITPDYNIEPNETFFVNLTGVTNGTITDTQGAGIINNDDVAGTVEFSQSNFSTLENNGTLSFTVNRTGGLGGGVTVTAATSDASAVGGTSCTTGVDYISAAPVLVFSGGQTSQTFAITLCNDSVFEDIENFNVTLSSPTGGLSIGARSTASGTINNDDNEPTYTINNVTQNEGNSGTSNFVFTVTKNGTSQINTTIGYQTQDGSASAGSDYQSTGGILTFAPNETTQTITVLVNGDTINEPNENFFITLGSIAVRGVNSGIGTILNDDAPGTPSVSLTVTANSGSEAGTTAIVVTATLTGGTVSTDQTVTLGTSGTATLNSDYTLAGGNLSGTTLTIPANTTSGSTTFTVINDTDVEADETATLTISNPSAGITLGTPVTQNITITSDDAAVSTLTAPNCTGIASSPLIAGSTDKALLCFALSSNSNASFTAVNVPFTTDPSVRFINPRLYRSTDADYTTTGDNILLATGSANATQFTFNGFNAFAENGEDYLPSLTSTPTNFFVVADVALTVNSSTPATQPSVAPANITVSNGMVMGVPVTGQNFSFNAIATAADGIIMGRVVNTNHRGLENVTVTLSGGSLVAPIVVYTNQTGRFRFTEIPTGEIYTITVSSKRHRFDQPATALSLTGTSENVNFVGAGW